MNKRLLALVSVLTMLAFAAPARAGITDDVLDAVFGVGAFGGSTPVKGTIEVAKTVTGQPAIVKLPGGEGDYPTQWSCDLGNVMRVQCTPGRAAPAGEWTCAPGGPWVKVTMSGLPGAYVHATSNCGDANAEASCIAATAGVTGACSDTGGVSSLTTFSCPITQHISVLEWHVVCHTWDP